MHAETTRKIFDAKLPLVLKSFMEAAVRYAGDKDSLAEIYMEDDPFKMNRHTVLQIIIWLILSIAMVTFFVVTEDGSLDAQVGWEN